MKFHRQLVILFAALVFPAGLCAAQAPESGDEKDAQEQTKPRSLDELLGLEEEADESTTDAATRERDEEIQRALGERDISNAFALAVKKMAVSADLLDVKFDPGLGTQRVQEDIIAKLEQLIDQARKLKSFSQGSSGGSPRDQSQQPTPNEQDLARQRSQQSPGQKQPQKGEGLTEGDPPAMQPADVSTVLEETRTEWGHLPQRIRDMLLQGRREKFSSLYERLTQEYYKRLAEEGSP